MSYNTVPVSLHEARTIAVSYLKAGIIPLLIAPPGVGKTSMAHLIAEDLGANLRTIRLNNIAPEAAAGLQYISKDGQNSVHLPPSWLPAPDGSEGPTLVFIDELTQAQDDQRKAIMSALLERYLGDTKVAPNCMFMAASNSADDGSNVYELDRATANRFAIILVRADLDQWANDWAPANDMDHTIVSLLRVRPDLFEMSENAMQSDDVIAPSPRSWHSASRFIKQAEMDGLSNRELEAGLMGILGLSVTEALMAVRKQVLELKSIRELLDMKPDERMKHVPETMEALWTYAQALIWHATNEKRVCEAFEILDLYSHAKDAQAADIRFSVAETILRRGRSVHGIDNLTSNKFLQAYMISWRKAVLQVSGLDEQMDKAA